MFADQRGMLRPISHAVVFGGIGFVVVEFLRAIRPFDVAPPARAHRAAIGARAECRRLARCGGIGKERHETPPVERLGSGQVGKIAKRREQIDEFHDAFGPGRFG